VFVYSQLKRKKKKRKKEDLKKKRKVRCGGSLAHKPIYMISFPIKKRTSLPILSQFGTNKYG
jgi:hypothetical protein